MDFTTQRELLEHIGKNPNDRSLVQRMITAWKVWRNSDWTWHLEEEDVERVRRENVELRKRIEELEKSDLKVISKAMGEKVLAHGEINNLKMDNSDLKDHLKFFYEMDLARKEAMENMVRAYYNNKPADWWEAAEAQAYKVMKFSPNPYEADEIEYVKGLID